MARNILFKLIEDRIKMITEIKEKEKIICDKCGQIIPTDELMKRIQDKYFRDRKYQSEYKKKKRLETKLLRLEENGVDEKCQ